MHTIILSVISNTGKLQYNFHTLKSSITKYVTSEVFMLLLVTNNMQCVTDWNFENDS